MPATLAPAATEGTKPKKPRGKSTFYVLNPVDLPILAQTTSLKDAMKQTVEMVDSDYIVVCLRAKVRVKTETQKKVKVL